MATLTVINNPFDHTNKDTLPIKAGSKLHELIPYTEDPVEYVVGLNGQITEDYTLIIQEYDSVTLVPVPSGGGGSKNIFRMIAMIAIGFAAPMLAASLTGYTGAMSMAAMYSAGAYGTMMLTAAFQIIGGLIVNALIPVPEATSPAATSYEDVSSTYSFSGGSNAREAGATLPAMFGKARVVPPIIASYVSLKDQDQYSNILMAVNDGLVDDITDIYINDQSISNYSGCTYTITKGTIDQEAIGNFRDTTTTSQVSVQLNENTTSHIFTTVSNNLGQVEVVVLLDRGLYYIEDSGSYSSRTLNLTIKLRPNGTTTWKHSVNKSISGTYKSPTRFTYLFDSMNTGIAISPQDSHMPKLDIEVIRTSSYDTSTRVANSFTYDYVNEIAFDDFCYPGVALLSINALATDQLNGAFPKVTCMCDNRTIIINGTTYLKDNPAWACYDMLLRAGVTANKINFNKFLAWAQYCDTKNLKCNLYLDNQMDLQSALNTASLLGRATVVQMGTIFTPIVDNLVDIPTQSFLFTGGNAGDFMIDYIAYPDRSNIIEVTYYDETNDYNAKTLQVQSPYFDAADTEVKSSVNLYGCTKMQQAADYAKFLLNNNLYITETISFSVDVDAIACTVGDLIKVGKKFMTNTLAEGRIVSATSTSITLDAEVYIDSNKDYEIQYRTLDDNIHVVSISKGVNLVSGMYSVIQTPTLSSVPDEYDVYAFGEAAYQAINLYKVITITRASDQKRKITALEYNPDVYNDAAVINVEAVLFAGAIQNLQATDYIRLSASGSALECVISLNWVGQALWYDVYLDGKKVGRTTQNYIDIPNVVEGKTYTVKVADSYNKNNSLTYTVVGRYRNPPAIGVITITELGNTFSLTWTYPQKPADFKEYIVYMQGVEIGRTTFNELKYYSPGIERKEFTVRAIDSVNLLSDPVSAFSQATVPNAVDTVSANVVGGKLTMTWTHTKEADFAKYLIYKDTVVIGSSTEKTFTYVELGDQCCTNIYYFVSVVDVSGLESTKVTTIVNITPSVVSNITNTFDKNNLTLKWDAVAGTFRIEKYKITINGDTYYAGANTFSAPVKWLGTKTISIVGIDTAGNEGTAATKSITITAPGAVTITTAISITSGVEFLWTEPTATVGVKEYEVTYNGSLTVLADRRYFVPTIDQGTYTVKVIAIDHAGNRGTEATKSVTIGKPTVTNVAYTAKGRNLTLSWAGNPSTFNIKEYRVSYSDGAGITQNITTPHMYFSVEPDWVGVKVFTIRAVDVAGNLGDAVTHSTTVSGPGNPVLSYQIVNKDALISITPTPGSFDLSVAEVKYYDPGTSQYITISVPAGTPVCTIPVTWDLDRTFSIKSKDVLGNYSNTVDLIVSIQESTVTAVTAEVVDNNVLLRWTYDQGTLPIEHFRVSKGTTYATAIEIGTRKGTFTPTFEQLGGVYTYWITPVDTAGNEGVYKSVTATVNEPPDYILNANWDSDWSGTSTNTEIVGEVGYLPVNTTETYQAHFTSRSWTSPNAQVSAGYPLWLSPTNTTAQYSQTFDYGALLPATSITITNPTVSIFGSGTYTMHWTIETSANGSTWVTEGTDLDKLFVTNIRYIKVTYTFTTSDSKTILAVSNFNITLNTKIRNDAGNGVTALASDTSGTYVAFNVAFIDIESINLTPKATSPVYLVYDFVDAPYPTGFYAYAYDSQGHRANADFSWSARGY